jgi:hypothetical protein
MTHAWLHLHREYDLIAWHVRGGKKHANLGNDATALLPRQLYLDVANQQLLHLMFSGMLLPFGFDGSTSSIALRARLTAFAQLHLFATFEGKSTSRLSTVSAFESTDASPRDRATTMTLLF